ncbi:MAG: carboxymuconolactone decarboxylase family protein, partial [Pseudomonadota bacterium]
LTDDLAGRDVLTLEERFAVQLGGLAALDLAPADLTGELTDLLKEGCPPELAEDVLIQMAAYLGYPRTRRCVACLEDALAGCGQGSDKRVLSGVSAAERYAVGIEDYARLNPDALSTIKTAFGALAPDVIELTFRIFGDVYAASRQSLQVRQLATVAALAVLGSAAPQLRFHIGAGRRVGLTEAQLVEVVAWVQFFAGAPAAYNALIELKASLAEGSGATPAYQ